MQITFVATQAVQLTPLLAAGISVVGSILGALLGGWIAVFNAGRRLRGERAFERRLDWFEKLSAVLYDLMEKGTLRGSSRSFASTVEVLAGINASVIQLQAVSAQAPLYASGRVCELLRELNDGAHDSAIAVVETLMRIRSSDPAEAVVVERAAYEAAKTHIDNYRAISLRTYVSVAAEARAHLGLERLKTPSWLSRTLRRARTERIAK
jgi:hypothetical protein